MQGKGGAPTETSMDPAVYKKTALNMLPEMKEKGYKATYSDVTVVPEEGGFRINGKSEDPSSKISFSTFYTVDFRSHCHLEEVKITTNSEQ